MRAALWQLQVQHSRQQRCNHRRARGQTIRGAHKSHHAQRCVAQLTAISHMAKRICTNCAYATCGKRRGGGHNLAERHESNLWKQLTKSSSLSPCRMALSSATRVAHPQRIATCWTPSRTTPAVASAKVSGRETIST